MKHKAQKTAFLGIMLGLMIVLTSLEAALPPIPFLPPHMKPGLANVLTMYCVFFIGRLPAIGLNIGKSAFVLAVRGPTAGLLSFCGGILSILFVILLIMIFNEKISYVAISILSAAAHNLGQLFALTVLINMPIWFYYLPVLMASSVVLGLLTGTVLRVVMPVLKRIS